MIKKIIALSKDLIISARPNTWLRVWGEMIIGATLAHPASFDTTRFFLIFLATSPLLWTAGYMLNDLTDRALDAQHPYRRSRPIAKGTISKKTAVSFIIFLTTSALAIGVFTSPIIVALLILLALSQIAYTIPPIRLKERPFFDIGINAINSSIRFLLGWFSQTPTSIFPYPIILGLMSIKIIFFLGHRMQNVTLEKKNNIHSTITRASPATIRVLFVIFFLISATAFVVSLLQGVLPPTAVYSLITVLPLIGYLFRHQGYFAQEQNLNFRNLLYLSYFMWANILAYIIYTSHP